MDQDLDPKPEEGRVPFGFLLKIETLSVSAVCSLKRSYFSLNDEDFITFRKQTSLWSVFLFLLYSCSSHHIWNKFFHSPTKQQQQCWPVCTRTSCPLCWLRCTCKDGKMFDCYRNTLHDTDTIFEPGFILDWPAAVQMKTTSYYYSNSLPQTWLPWAAWTLVS